MFVVRPNEIVYILLSTWHMVDTQIMHFYSDFRQELVFSVSLMLRPSKSIFVELISGMSGINNESSLLFC